MSDASAADADLQTCLVGVADGCCPSDEQFGGHDPDCPSLACPSLTIGDRIVLDIDSPSLNGGVGMAWSGKELLLAWTGTRPTPTQWVRTIISERRDTSGAIVAGPSVHDDLFTKADDSHGVAELGLDPSTGHAYFVSTSTMNYLRYGELLDSSSAPISSPLFFGAACNPISYRHQIYPWQGRFLVAQEDHDCVDQDWNGPRVDVVDTTGALEMTSRVPSAVVNESVGMTYNAADGLVMFSYGIRLLSAVSFEPPSSWGPGTAFVNLQLATSAIAFDGSRYAIEYGQYMPSGSPQVNPSVPIETAIWDPSSSTHPNPFGSLVTPDESRQLVPARLVWTGDGWLEFLTGFPYEGQGLPSAWSQFRTLVVSLAPDGTVRQRFDLDSHPSYLVNAIWAGGHVAVTWVGPDEHGVERHYLRYLDCAP